MNAFFSHEHHLYFPLLFDGGKLRFGKKCDLLSILTRCHETVTEPPDFTDVVLFDRAAVLPVLSTGSTVTFDK